MPKQLVALLHLSLSDLVTSGGFATAFLTGGSLPYLLFLMALRSWQHLRTKLTSLLGIFHAIPPLMMASNSFPIFYLVLNRDSALRILPPKWFLVQSMILVHPKPLAPTEFKPLSSRFDSFILFLLTYTINAWPNPVFLPVGNLHRLCQFLKMMMRDLIQVSIVL